MSGPETVEASARSPAMRRITHMKKLRDPDEPLARLVSRADLLRHREVAMWWASPLSRRRALGLEGRRCYQATDHVPSNRH